MVARNTVLQIVGEVLSRAASLGFYVVMARELGKSGFGGFTLAASLTMFIELSGLGTDALLTREVARGRERIHMLFWNANAVKLVFGLAALVLVIGLAYVGDYGADVRAAVALLALAGLFEVGSKTVFATFRGLENVVPIVRALMLQRFLTAAVGIAAMLAGAGLVPVSIVYLVFAGVAWAVIHLDLYRSGLRPRFAPSRRRAYEIVVLSLPLALSSAFTFVLARLDIVLLSFIKGNPAVATYSAAYRIFEAILFLSWNFGLSMLPSFARLGAETSPSIGRAYEVASKVVALTMFPVGAAQVLFAHPITTLLYGSAYADAVPSMRLLGVATAVSGFYMLSVQLLTAQDRRRLIAIISAIVLVENAALNLILIPAHSYTGAAEAWLASQATLSALMVAASLRETGRIAWVRAIGGPLVGCGAMGLVALATGFALPGFALALVVYVLVVGALEHRLFPEDVQLLRQALRRRRA